MAYRLSRAPITSEQLRAVVTALTAPDTASRLQSWPELLRVLEDWANKLHGAATGLQHRKPQRPWERNAQQQPITAITQQQQQQQQEADNFQLLQEAVVAVVAALDVAAAAKQGAFGDLSRSASNELVAILGPALSFLAAAVTAAAGLITADGTTAVQQLQTTAVAASCSATSAAMPALLTSGDLAVLPAVLSSYQQLTLSRKDNPQHISWLVSCLLASLQDALPTSLMQVMASASISSIPASAASATLQDWAAQQTQEYVTTCVIGQLAGLFTLGHAVGLATCQAAAGASAPTVSSSHSMHAGNTADNPVLQAFVEVSRLLQSGCGQAGDPAAAALSAAVAAGLVAGSLEASSAVAVPPAASAAANGLLSDVWASATQHGQGPQNQQFQEALAVQEPSSLRRGWQLDLQQQQLLLLQAVDLACQQSWNAAVSSPATAAAAGGGGQGHEAALSAGLVQLLGHAYSRLITHSHAVQQLQPQHSTASIQCSLMYAVRQCCGLSGLMHFAGCCSDPAAANAWLTAQQQQHPPTEVGLLARWLAEAVSSLQGEQQLLLLQAVRTEAETAADSYDCYLLVTQPELLQQVDAAAVRQQLDRLFATVVSVLAAVWQQQQQQQQANLQLANARPSAPAPTQNGSSSGTDCPHSSSAAFIAQGLGTLAALQFCQLQLPAYVDLLRGLVGTLASSTAAADAFLSDALPCYDALVDMVDQFSSSGSGEQQCMMESERSISSNAPTASSSIRAGQQCMTGSTVDCECESVRSSNHATAGSSSSSSAAQPWLTRPVLIARLSFLLPLIPLAYKASSNQAAANARVLPLVLLLLPHPVRQLSEAAHSAFAGLLTAAVETAAAAAATPTYAWDQQQQQQRDPALTVLQQAIPFYLQRSLEGLPHSGSLEGLAISFSSILKQLSAGNIMSLLVVTNVTDCAATWAQQAAAEGHPVVHAPVQRQQRSVAVESNQASGTEGPITAGGSSGSGSPAAVAAAKLFELVQLSLQLVDYQLLPSVLQHTAAVVKKAHRVVQQQWIQGLYATCIANDDYARKPALIQWIDGLNKDVLLLWWQHDAASKNAGKEGDTSSESAARRLAQPPFLVS